MGVQHMAAATVNGLCLLLGNVHNWVNGRLKRWVRESYASCPRSLAASHTCGFASWVFRRSDGTHVSVPVQQSTAGTMRRPAVQVGQPFHLLHNLPKEKREKEK